jgi:hypothetical protein
MDRPLISTVCYTPNGFPTYWNYKILSTDIFAESRSTLIREHIQGKCGMFCGLCTIEAERYLDNVNARKKV